MNGFGETARLILGYRRRRAVDDRVSVVRPPVALWRVGLVGAKAPLLRPPLCRVCSRGVVAGVSGMYWPIPSPTGVDGAESATAYNPKL